jgi:selenium metabolism protein YedF
MEGLDCRGQSCPQPVVETKKRLDSMSEGMLTVLVDNETARNNLLKLAASMNLDTSVSAEKGIFAVTLRKTAQLPRSSRDDDKPAALLVTAETMGRGSDELGALLMRSFFYALAEQDKLPAAVYLVNSAVRLACGGSDALDSLQKLSSTRSVNPFLRHVSGLFQTDGKISSGRCYKYVCHCGPPDGR